MDGAALTVKMKTAAARERICRRGERRNEEKKSGKRGTEREKVSCCRYLFGCAALRVGGTVKQREDLHFNVAFHIFIIHHIENNGREEWKRT